MSTKLSVAVNAYRKAESRTVDRGQCACILNDQSLINELASYELLLSPDTSCKTHECSPISDCVEFELPANFMQTFSGFLMYGNNRSALPDDFFIAEINYHYKEDNNIPLVIEAYFRAITVIDILHQCSDYIDEEDTPNTLIFLCPKHGKLTLHIDYTQESLHNSRVTDEALSFLNEYLDGGEKHQKQVQYMVKECLFTMLKTVADNQKLTHLFISFDTFIQNIRCHYELFLSDLDHYEIVKTFEREKIDYISSVGKIFGDLQNKLLAIPLGLIFAATNINFNDFYDIKNKAIFFGVFAFIGLMILLVNSHRKTLESLQNDYTNKFDHYKNHYPNVYVHILPIFKTLEGQVLYQSKQLGIIRCAIYALCPVLIVLFALCFPNISQYAMCFLQYILL